MTETYEGRWLTTPEVAARCGVAVETVRWWRKRAAQRGPTFYRLSQNVVRYREDDVNNWLALRAVETEG